MERVVISRCTQHAWLLGGLDLSSSSSPQRHDHLHGLQALRYSKLHMTDSLFYLLLLILNFSFHVT